MVIDAEAIEDDIRREMTARVGIVRNEEGMKTALEKVKNYEKK